MKPLYSARAKALRPMLTAISLAAAIAGLVLPATSIATYARSPLIVTSTPLPEPSSTPSEPTPQPTGIAPTPVPPVEGTATPSISTNPRPNPPDPYVQLSGCATACVNPGDVAELTAIAGNNSASTAAVNVQVRHTVPANYELVEVTTSRGTVINNGAEVIVDIGTLNPQEVVTIKIKLRVKAGTAPGDAPLLVTLNTTSQGDVASNNISYATCQVCQIVLPETGATERDSSGAILLMLLGLGLLLGGASLRQPRQA